MSRPGRNNKVSQSNSGHILRAALVLLQAGVSVIPILLGGEKRPPFKWGNYQVRRATEAEARGWFEQYRGLAAVCGEVSGGLEVIDFDREAQSLYPKWCAMVEDACPGTVERLVVVRTPREPAGYHVWYRCPGHVQGNDKLAGLSPDEGQAEKDTAKAEGRKAELTLIETRGEGGYALVPGGDPAAHETGRPYEYLGEGLTDVPTITPDEREALIACARSLDRSAPQPAPLPRIAAGVDLRPGDDFDQRGSWDDVLLPAGWTKVGEATGGEIRWRRPGKHAGWSATTGVCKGGDGSDLLHVFSSNCTPLEAQRTYGKFRAFAELHHGGDLSATAAALRLMGFGSQGHIGNGKARKSDVFPVAQELLDEAAAPALEGRPEEEDDDPHRLARIFLEQSRMDEAYTLAYYREQWHSWKAGAYRRILAKELTARLTSAIKAEFDRIALASEATAASVTQRLVGDVEGALRGEALVPGDTAPPCWLNGHEGPDPEGLLVCTNGLVRLQDWAEGRPCLAPLTPRLFTPNALTFAFDPKASAPERWLAFLRQLWGVDRGEVGFLQEWAGYLLTADTSQQKIAFLVGPKRSGKGTICRVFTDLVGRSNVCNPTLGSLGGNFGLQPLLDKTSAFVTDARLDGRADGSLIVERLLSISGEDSQTVDRKHLTAVTGKLPVRFTLVSNELPKLKDSSGALASRLIILRFVRCFYGQEDHALTRALGKELPGILLWAMEGWKRLAARGHFIPPASSTGLVREMEELSSPISAFLRERCRRGDAERVETRRAWGAWEAWCRGRGQQPGTAQSFGRDLRSALPGLETKTARDPGDGQVLREYRGFRLLRAGEGPDEPLDEEEDV
jgi:putative DNA primase/helicase